MKKLSVLLLFISLFLLAGLYFFLSYQNGGICLKPPICTKDEKTFCHPKGGQIWQGPSLCSCGLDAAVLQSRDWIECEIPENYQGNLRTASAPTELPQVKFPKTLPLFVVPVIFLTIGIGTLIILWGRQK